MEQLVLRRAGVRVCSADLESGESQALAPYGDHLHDGAARRRSSRILSYLGVPNR